MVAASEGAGIEPGPSVRRAPVLLVGAGIVAAFLALMPLVYIVLRAFEQGSDTFVDILWRPRTFELAARSLWLATVVTVGCVVIGTASAWLVTRTDVPGRRVLQIALGLPLAMPSYVAAWGWLGFRPSLAGGVGATIVLTTISYPFVYLPTLAALRRCDPSIEDAARTLGDSRARAFFRTTIPQIRTAIIGGGLLVGLYVLSDFGAVATMRYEVLTQTIYRSYRASFDRTPAAVLGCVLAVMTITIMLVEGRVHRRTRIARVGSGAPRPQSVVALGPWRWPAAAGAASLVGLSLGVPLWGLAQWYQRGSSRADATQLVDAARNTILIGAVGALAVVAVALPVAVLAVRYPSRVSRGARTAAYVGHALPGVIVGLALVFFGVRFARPLYQQLPMLVVAYIVLYMSLAFGAIQVTVAQIPTALEEVSRTLGRSALGAWCSTTGRLALTGIVAAGTLVCLTVMKELPATLFLRPTGFDTLATRLWSHTSAFSYAAAAPYALTIIAVAVVPTALLSIVGSRRRA